MVMFQITEDEQSEIKELCKGVLYYGGKLMSIVENMSEEGSMGMRSGMGMRQDGGRYGMGMRYDEPMGMRGYGMRDEDSGMGERRDRYGRYTR